MKYLVRPLPARVVEARLRRRRVHAVRPGRAPARRGGDALRGVSVGPPRAGGRAQCTACAPGTYAAAAGSRVCTPCAPNTYQPYVVAEACFPCHAGTYQEFEGATSCKVCGVGDGSGHCGAGSGGGGNASAVSGADGPGSAEEVVVYGSRAVYGLALLPLAAAASAVRGHYGARRV